ncbi:hypothetical protein PR048_015300 [Dryococelus australis]|uniref:Transposase n=1 Tax=Dryococelus australis TaxID=614101 RepID=A0ABQ9HGL0_9NEOP|nr:hypothetical protein PR048_015300 [Dryococelus australis]
MKRSVNSARQTTVASPLAPHFTLIGSLDFVAKSRPNTSTHLITFNRMAYDGILKALQHLVRPLDTVTGQTLTRWLRAVVICLYYASICQALIRIPAHRRKEGKSAHGSITQLASWHKSGRRLYTMDAVCLRSSHYLTGPLRVRQHGHGSYVIRVQTVNTYQKVIQPIKNDCLLLLAHRLETADSTIKTRLNSRGKYYSNSRNKEGTESVNMPRHFLKRMVDEPQLARIRLCRLNVIDKQHVKLKMHLSTQAENNDAVHSVDNTSVDLCFTAFGVGPLVFVRGIMNTEACCNILDNEMLPTLWRFYGMDPCYFQGDNASQSHDLNPIEHIWDELDHRVRARQARPKSIYQLMEWLQEEWRQIPVDVLQTLVESMPDRVAAVIAARGGPTILYRDSVELCLHEAEEYSAESSKPSGMLEVTMYGREVGRSIHRHARRLGRWDGTAESVGSKWDTREIWADFNNEVSGADESEMRKPTNQRHRPVPYFPLAKIRECPDPGIEPGLPWWEASILAAQPRILMTSKRTGDDSRVNDIFLTIKYSVKDFI